MFPKVFIGSSAEWPLVGNFVPKAEGQVSAPNWNSYI